jgi:hypothetical protein
MLTSPRFLLALALMALLLPSSLSAQDWVAESKIRPVSEIKTAAYWDVFLPPSLTAYLAPGCGNVRVHDKNGEEVPFLFRNDKAAATEMSIRWLDKVGGDYWARWYSRNIFENRGGKLTDRLALRIRNADVTQNFWLSGSDNRTDWYIIKEDYRYDAAYNPQAGSNLLTIHFPPVDYKYFKVELRHYWEEPIQIMGAGIYAFDTTKGNFTEVTGLDLAQKEEGRQSLVTLELGARHYLDRLFLEIDGPELYHREARLQRHLGGETGTWDDVKAFTISSESAVMLQLPGIRAERLRIVIENKDDKPLRVAGARAWQTRKFLTMRMESGAPYTIKIGPEDLRAPEYDLAYFDKKLPSSMGVQWAGSPVSLLAPPAPAQGGAPAAPAQVEEPVKPFFQHPAFLWGGIGLIVLVLGFLSIRMLREMSAGDKQQPPQ